mmetsp:Transcript_44967/g.82152  ORF Transcript_44967/g.82152 Transcript_44967/m.82152 type:complete len:259 (-) Transcript_44967:36-812(-)
MLGTCVLAAVVCNAGVTGSVATAVESTVATCCATVVCAAGSCATVVCAVASTETACVVACATVVACVVTASDACGASEARVGACVVMAATPLVTATVAPSDADENGTADVCGNTAEDGCDARVASCVTELAAAEELTGAAVVTTTAPVLAATCVAALTNAVGAATAGIEDATSAGGALPVVTPLGFVASAALKPKVAASREPSARTLLRMNPTRLASGMAAALPSLAESMIASNGSATANTMSSHSGSSAESLWEPGK